MESKQGKKTKTDRLDEPKRNDFFSVLRLYKNDTDTGAVQPIYELMALTPFVRAEILQLAEELLASNPDSALLDKITGSSSVP